MVLGYGLADLLCGILWLIGFVIANAAFVLRSSSIAAQLACRGFTNKFPALSNQEIYSLNEGDLPSIRHKRHISVL